MHRTTYAVKISRENFSNTSDLFLNSEEYEVMTEYVLSNRSSHIPSPPDSPETISVLYGRGNFQINDSSTLIISTSKKDLETTLKSLPISKTSLKEFIKTINTNL